MVINPIVGVYIPIIRIPIKGWMTIPNIATFDHGTFGSIFRCFPQLSLQKKSLSLWRMLGISETLRTIHHQSLNPPSQILSPLPNWETQARTTKTSTVLEIVLNLCSLWWSPKFCCKNWGRSLVVHLWVAKSGRSSRILTEDARSAFAWSSGSCHHQTLGVKCLGQGASAEETVGPHEPCFRSNEERGTWLFGDDTIQLY